MNDSNIASLPKAAVGDWKAGAAAIASQDLEDQVRTEARKLANAVRPPAPKPEASKHERIEMVNADLRRWQMAMNVVIDAERQKGNQHVSIAGAYQLVNIKQALDAIANNDEPLMIEPYAARALSGGFPAPAEGDPKPESEKAASEAPIASSKVSE